ncbi:phenylacetate-CoA ligase [Algoriphagus aquaeductus]|uniref:Phenylacetate-CoA ligase n=1 Tax=Algoriphagus aquaeductus TaxID=475299 RepID=A0A326RL17_9BACT|nr:phenylacetate--CoA ligase family protein [Algoriphagus aquaeductus]PZV79135.1 phenylacetate-CoA ligase [Algoriphagus aquaeductus]
MLNFHKWLFFKGAKKRNPSIFAHFEELKKTEQSSQSELLKLNEERLKKICCFAFQHSDFYKKRFEEANFNPCTSWSLEAFRKLKPVEKKELIEFNESIHTPKSFFKKRFFVETSGTSGEILTFHRDESWDSFNRAAIWRGYSWFGANPWDRKLYFWGYNTAPLKRIKLILMDFLVNRFRLFDYDPEKLRKLLPRLKHVKIIEGYSSMIYELANLIKNDNPSFDSLKLVKGTSEKVFPHYQDIARRIYKMPIANEYGSTESGIIAFECPKGSMHINMEGVHVERDSEDGGIIVTNLQSFSFPTIRYKLGDEIVLAPSEYKCACGMESPIIMEVTGRIGKKIFGKNQIYPSLTLYYIFKNIYFNENRSIDFQAHQYQKGRMEIWVKEKVTPELENLVFTEAKKYFSDIELTLKEKYDFRQQAGKLRDFVSHLD